MPHATECSPNLISPDSLSSPIQIPHSASTSFGRNSGSSYSTSTSTSVINDYCNPTENINCFDQSYQASSDEGSTYTPTITPDPVSRNIQQSYPRDYICCGIDHQNLLNLLQHVDNSHPGLIVLANRVIPFETHTVYSQDRWDPMSTISIPPPSVSTTSLTTLTSNSSTHDQKSFSSSVPPTSLYAIPIPNNKQKGNINNNGFGQPNGYGIGQIDKFDQVNDINGMLNGQNQDSLCEDWMLAVMYGHSPKLPTITPNHHSYGPIPSSVDKNSISHPRRSSTSTITQSQPVSIMSQSEQYRSLLGQGNISNSVKPQLRRSSTSNLTPTCTYNIPIDKSTYITSVTAAPYPMNTVDDYSMVGHVSSGEAGPGAVNLFSSKFLRIQPKAGAGNAGVTMSDVYTDPSIDKCSKKRTVSASPAGLKSPKRRATKSSDESVTETPVSVPTDLSSEMENRNEADIYPYKCAVPGCPKVYKNANGLKYHNEHGHASQSGNGAREKPWSCQVGGCLKAYGSKGGLIYHVKRCHPNDLWALP